MSFTSAVPAVIVLAQYLAAVAALLRVWGTAYLGPATVNSLSMKAGSVVADGPYRYVRNPLYLGLWFMVAALAFLMPPTGALCAIVLVTLFILRLTLAEEAFLGGTPRRTLSGLPARSSALPAAAAQQHPLQRRASALVPLHGGGTHAHRHLCVHRVCVVDLQRHLDGPRNTHRLRSFAGHPRAHAGHRKRAEHSSVRSAALTLPAQKHKREKL